jgi:hypothetical protein
VLALLGSWGFGISVFPTAARPDFREPWGESLFFCSTACWLNMVENRGPELLAVCATFVSMAFVSVVLRCYVRLRIVKAFGWDDGFMVVALVSRLQDVRKSHSDRSSFSTSCSLRAL